MDVTFSPSGNKMIYTRLPDAYETPHPIPHDYVGLAEIWVAENPSAIKQSRTTYPLLNGSHELYDCGSALSVESKWFFDETLIVGSCFFDYGITTVCFMADLLDRKIEFLNFEDTTGQYVPTEDIAVAHKRPKLAFYANGTFWIVSGQTNAGEIPLKLSEQNFLFDDRPAAAPIWSSDDQWIYYWTYSEPTKYDKDGFVED